MDKKIYQAAPDEVYAELGVQIIGLTHEEAQKKLQEVGKNIIDEKKEKPLIVKFLSNFTHLMAILLWVGGFIAFLAETPQLGWAIWIVNIVNGLFSFWQEYKAGKATDELTKLMADQVTVIRNGEEEVIAAEDLVPNDIVKIEEGNSISADCRLVEAHKLMINQSTLTGESRPVHKLSDADERDEVVTSDIRNMIFAGTDVVSGAGRAIVLRTGMKTELGKIAGLTNAMEEKPSPLQKELNRITKTISIIAVLIGVAFFLMALFLVDNTVAASFIFAMGMVVAFIPEGLLPTVTLSLAMAVQRMAKRHALMKKLSAVETLGCTNVICTDKTGTLTKNEMTVNDAWLPSGDIFVSGIGYAKKGEIRQGKTLLNYAESTDGRELMRGAALCNDARLKDVIENGNCCETPKILGDPTEAALLVFAQKGKKGVADIQAECQRIKELPFDSQRKRMSTVHIMPDGSKMAYIKGAPSETIGLCTSYLVDGEAHPMTKEIATRIQNKNDYYAVKGLRVLAVAQKKMSDTDYEAFLAADEDIDMVESELVFIGLIAMSDPPRAEVKNAVIECQRAGIRIIMITGDYGLTAKSIAKNIGIVRGSDPRVISGIELGKMTDDELKQALEGEVVFARVAPDQKLKVVTALQEMGKVVAVTGDGVNDAPALKKADIGVAMGRGGTDVAKKAADMILTDDNFASIVHAIEEGRAVYSNIGKFITYIFTSNVAEAIPPIFYLLSGGAIPLPLVIMQVLAIDLGTDLIPAIALGTERPEPGIMHKPPRDHTTPLLNKTILWKAFGWYGIIEAAGAMISYFFANFLMGWPDSPLASTGEPYRFATTMTFAAIVFGQIGAVMCCRSDKVSLFKKGIFSNRFLLFGIIFEVLLLAVFIYTPFLEGTFNTAPIEPIEWLFLLIWIPFIIVLDEIRKWFLRKKDPAFT